MPRKPEPKTTVYHEREPRILFLDIETAPAVSYIWKRWKETVGQSQILREGYVLCLSWQWLGSKDPVRNASIYKSAAWQAGRWEDDREAITVAWRLFDQADIIVGHNIRDFDIGTLNSRFASLGFPPPSPYRIVDTLEVAKRRFRFPANSLEALSHYLGVPNTKEKQGFELWRDCLRGLAEAWRKMVDYCNNDVVVLAQVYQRLLPWMDTHPNLGLYAHEGSGPVCGKCGSTSLQWRGLQHTMVNVYRRFRCNGCGGWGRARLSEKIDREHVTTHAVVS